MSRSNWACRTPEPAPAGHKNAMALSFRAGPWRVTFCWYKNCQGVSADRYTPFFNELVGIRYRHVEILL